MVEQCAGLYASGALAKLRELHSEFASSGNLCQLGGAAREEWERALCQAGPALLSVAEENERLLSLIRMIACNHDAEWGRQLARHYLGVSNPHPVPAPVGHAEGKEEPAGAIIEEILREADALFRRRLNDSGFELPCLVLIMAPDNQVVLRGNVSAEVLRLFGEALNDVADQFAPAELNPAAH